MEAQETQEANEAATARCDRRVLSMLVCPSTRTELVYDAARQELVSRAARLAYPIRDGVPVMTPDEARPLDDDEMRTLAKRCASPGPGQDAGR
jgi:uncharacterized protein YbaR (Trm112 family)